VEPGLITSSALVGASGSLVGTRAHVEVSVSPQDGTGSFVGDELTSGAFSFNGVTVTPVGSTNATPLALQVDQVEAFAPKSGAASAILLFDSSGSMRDNDPGRQGRVDAARAFIDVVHGSLEVAVLDFGAGRSDGLDASRILQPFTDDQALLEKALEGLADRGGTPMYEALGDAISVLDREQRAGAVVLLTDGLANGSHASVITRAKSTGVPIYAVGLGSNLDFGVLRELGIETGGAFVDAADRRALAAAFQGVGTGVAVGQVRLRARGLLPASLQPGAYDVKGNVVTADAEKGTRIEHPFGFRTVVQR
jgi:hypothetical protein